MRDDTHLAVKRTAQRHTCKGCGRKSSSPRSQRNRAACPPTRGQVNRTVAVEAEEEVEAGRAAGGSEIGMTALSGYSPLKYTKNKRSTQRGIKKQEETKL